MTSTDTDVAPANAGTGAEGEAHGLYSIGTVSSMLGVPAATLRTWEERYGVIAPRRTPAGHRLYTRRHVEQLRFVVAETRRGISAADAHRALAEFKLEPAHPADSANASRRLLILVAERDRHSADLLEFLLRTDGFAVEVAFDVDQAKSTFAQTRPDLVVVELLVNGGAGLDLCRWLKEQATTPLLVVSPLDAADRALAAGADAFLLKPVGHVELAFAVKDLLGVSAIVAREGSRRGG